nr:hypothetical protein GCM10025732_09730 [Glycomyces mayteni]
MGIWFALVGISAGTVASFAMVGWTFTRGLYTGADGVEPVEIESGTVIIEGDEPPATPGEIEGIAGAEPVPGGLAEPGEGVEPVAAEPQAELVQQHDREPEEAPARPSRRAARKRPSRRASSRSTRTRAAPRSPARPPAGKRRTTAGTPGTTGTTATGTTIGTAAGTTGTTAAGTTTGRTATGATRASTSNWNSDWTSKRPNGFRPGLTTDPRPTPAPRALPNPLARRGEMWGRPPRSRNLHMRIAVTHFEGASPSDRDAHGSRWGTSKWISSLAACSRVRPKRA